MPAADDMLELLVEVEVEVEVVILQFIQRLLRESRGGHDDFHVL